MSYSFKNRFLVVCFSCCLLISHALLAGSSEWKVITSKDLGTLPGSAQVRSISLTRTEGDVQDAVVQGVVFNASSYGLQVINNIKRDKTLAQVMQGSDYLAGINGGYFYPNGVPLGLVMKDGKVLHKKQGTRLLSGFFIANDQGLFLLRIGEKLPSKMKEVLQSGPFLIDRGGEVAGLESRRVARRTFLATNGEGYWIMGVISPVTLAEASHILLTAAPRFFQGSTIQRALNLDGGSSSALWVALHPEPFSQSEFGYVSNFLGLLKK